MISTTDIVRIQPTGQRDTVGTSTTVPPPGPKPAAGPSFADELAQVQPEPFVHFSKHAQQRLQERHIDLGKDETDRLHQAFDALARKGGRQSLVLLDGVALVVHVQSGTVVTAMGSDERKEAVFTQIDSVAIA